MTKARSAAVAPAAKGDLRVGSGSLTSGVLSVGSDGSALVADSTATNGVSWAGPLVTAGKNLLINGGFDIWQRGTSFASGGYMADRWTDSSTLSNMTASQQTSGAPNGSRYILRYTATAGSAYRDLKHYIETAQVQQAWGNTVTFSIKMRRNSTATGGNFNWAIEKSSTVDAGSGATWTGLVTASTTVASLTTGTTSADWTTVTISAVVPNDGTANSLRVTAGFSVAQANGSIIEFAQAQLELGSVATPFSRAGGTIQGELAACQRYYYVHSEGNNEPICMGSYNSTTSMEAVMSFPVTMRTAPTISQTTGTNYYSIYRNGAEDYFNSFTIEYSSTKAVAIYNNTEISGTAGQVGFIRNTNASAKLAFSAEL